MSNNRIVPGKSLDERPRPPRDNIQLSLVFAAEAVAPCIERGTERCDLADDLVYCYVADVGHAEMPPFPDMPAGTPRAGSSCA
jgi:hypothetical protein